MLRDFGQFFDGIQNVNESYTGQFLIPNANGITIHTNWISTIPRTPFQECSKKMKRF